MLAQKDDNIKEASNTIYELSQEEKIRLQCEAREDYYRRECRIAKQHEEINDLEARIADMQDVVSEKDAQIAALKAELDRMKQTK